MNEKLKKLKVSTKILIPIIFVSIFGNMFFNYISTSKMQEISRSNTISSLEMLTDSIFITLRNAMNTGDPAIIKDAENHSRDNINGLDKLIVSKSKETIEMYSPSSSFTRDIKTLEVFTSKKQLIIDVFENDKHFLRVLKPMIATQDCLACHANQNLGDVIGVIDLSFDLDKSDQKIEESSLFLLFISLAVIFSTILIVLFVVSKVTKPLNNLRGELEEFFEFISFERKTIKAFKVHSHDEIGLMVEAINSNIEKTVKGMSKDSAVIQESTQMCELASKGDLSVQINSQANNPEINMLKDIVNNLISSMNYNIKRVLTTLDDFSNDSYDSRINSKGTTTAQIKELFLKVDHLGETLVRLSSQNLKNGLALEQTSEVFSNNVQQLSDSSKDQSSALSLAGDNLQDMTTKLKNTSQNTKKMQEYSKKLLSSTKEGENLANETLVSMSEINEKVNAINEAINIIDQIAFQTNILSLNAAVEAATAGESGKGFAVVAQEVRNLANRSAEAAKEIKDLVEDAKNKAKMGEAKADNMINGYTSLNENIDSTIDLIELVAKDSLVQQNSIEDINNTLIDLNKQTKENVKLAEETNIVAQQASNIATLIVKDAGGKNFSSKKNIKVRKKIFDLDFKGPERRGIESELKRTKQTINLDKGKDNKRVIVTRPSVANKNIKNNEADEWESF